MKKVRVKSEYKCKCDVDDEAKKFFQKQGQVCPALKKGKWFLRAKKDNSLLWLLPSAESVMRSEFMM